MSVREADIEERVPLPKKQASVAFVGDPGGRLLAGPPAAAGAERWRAHEDRLGALAPERSSTEWLRIFAESGLRGRGGGQFPTAKKLETAANSSLAPLVVVNASEGEPASAKDRLLCELRPHLVIDGAEVAACAVGGDEVILFAHRGTGGERLREAIGERPPSRSIKWLVEPAHRYVAGETSAIVSALEGDGPRPHRRPLPVAAVGVGGRPTVVLNAETCAHLALIARFGAQWFRGAGSTDCPGSSLVTIVGNAPGSGTVVEIGAPVTIGELLVAAAGISRTPRAVLLGGYAGTWIPGDAAMRTPLERSLLSRFGTPLGCGIVGVLDAGDCGVAETARLFRWLAQQSSGQCGPCVLGLPLISKLLDDLVEGVAKHGDLRRLAGLVASVRGRGACGHPTGAIGLLESALETFRAEVQLHRRGTRCEARGAEIGFPLPPPANDGKFS